MRILSLEDLLGLTLLVEVHSHLELLCVGVDERGDRQLLGGDSAYRGDTFAQDVGLEEVLVAGRVEEFFQDLVELAEHVAQVGIHVGLVVEHVLGDAEESRHFGWNLGVFLCKHVDLLLIRVELGVWLIIEESVLVRLIILIIEDIILVWLIILIIEDIILVRLIILIIEDSVLVRLIIKYSVLIILIIKYSVLIILKL